MFSRMLQWSAALAILLASMESSYAAPISFSTGGASQTGIGRDLVNYPDSVYDQLYLTANSGTFSGPGTITLNPVEFVAGINSCCAASYSGLSISESLTLNGNTHTLNIPYTIDISSADTLSILSGTTLFFPGWQVVLNSLVLGPNGGGSQFAFLTATVTQTLGQGELPLPPALLLFGSALVGLGALGRRKRQRAAV